MMLNSILLATTAALATLQAPGPSPELKKLDFLLGDWTSTEKSFRPNQEPVDFTLRGKNAWSMEGRYLRIEESFEFAGTKNENLILMSYDPQAKAYAAWWFTIGSPRPIVFSGVFEGEKFVLTRETDPKRPGAAIRITYSPKSVGVFDAVLEVKRGEKFEVLTEAHYVRKG